MADAEAFGHWLQRQVTRGLIEEFGDCPFRMQLDYSVVALSAAPHGAYARSRKALRILQSSHTFETWLKTTTTSLAHNALLSAWSRFRREQWKKRR